METTFDTKNRRKPHHQDQYPQNNGPTRPGQNGRLPNAEALQYEQRNISGQKEL